MYYGRELKRLLTSVSECTKEILDQKAHPPQSWLDGLVHLEGWDVLYNLFFCYITQIV